MKTQKITVEIPAHMTAAEFTRRVEMLSSPNWMASWWHISDVLGQSNGWEDGEKPTITDDEAREVLRLLDKYHDCSEGVNWDVIDGWIDHVKQNRKAAA